LLRAHKGIDSAPGISQTVATGSTLCKTPPLKILRKSSNVFVGPYGRVGALSPEFRFLDVQQVAVCFQCTVSFMCKYTFCKNLTQLNTFLIEAV